jgi:hypothetical protein
MPDANQRSVHDQMHCLDMPRPAMLSVPKQRRAHTTQPTMRKTEEVGTHVVPVAVLLAHRAFGGIFGSIIDSDAAVIACYGHDV